MLSLVGAVKVCVEIAFAGTNSFGLDRGISNVLEDNVKLVICVHLTVMLERVFRPGWTNGSFIEGNETSNHWMITRTPIRIDKVSSSSRVFFLS